MKKPTTILFMLCCFIGYAQKVSIEYESNGKSETLVEQNPFQKFIGEWTLKNDDWTHNWGNGTETIKIPNHHTVSTGINTTNSLISIIDGPEPNGHIFWSYNPNTGEVSHLSSFGAIRAGKGNGTINRNSDLTLKLTFEGEPANTYRIYTYKWINEDEYYMKSIQYDETNQPTGLFYEGHFVRIKNNKTDVEVEITTILNVLDSNEITIEEQLEVYSDNIVHMAPNANPITDKESLKSYLNQQREYGVSKMKHHIISIENLGDHILMRGEVKGTFYPTNGSDSLQFKTKNLFVFTREHGNLKIQKVIYNMSPVQ